MGKLCQGRGGLRELPLMWKTGWEGKATTNLRIVGGKATTDLEFRVYKESRGVKRGLTDWKNKEWQRDEKWCGEKVVWQEWRSGELRGTAVVSEGALSSSHIRASSSSTFCLASMHTTKSTRSYSFKMPYFPTVFCFHSLSFNLMHKYAISGQLVESTRSLSQISVMYMEFHSSSPSVMYINIPESYTHP